MFAPAPPARTRAARPNAAPVFALGKIWYFSNVPPYRHMEAEHWKVTDRISYRVRPQFLIEIARAVKFEPVKPERRA